MCKTTQTRDAATWKQKPGTHFDIRAWVALFSRSGPVPPTEASAPAIFDDEALACLISGPESGRLGRRGVSCAYAVMQSLTGGFAVVVVRYRSEGVVKGEKEGVVSGDDEGIGTSRGQARLESWL